jgi:hypothetical protein
MKKLASVREADAGNHPRERALTGAICADQSNDLTTINGERNLSERSRGAITFGYRIQRKQVFSFHWPTVHSRCLRTT